MSEEETHNNLIRVLKLAWDLECGISWYDVEETKKELAHIRWKYQVEPFDPEDEFFHLKGES